MLLGELADRLGLFDALSAAIPDPCDPRFIIHDQRTLIAQRVFASASGHEDLNDHQTLRADSTLQASAGQRHNPELTLASPPALCHLENRVDRKALVMSAEILIDQFSLPTPSHPNNQSSTLTPPTTELMTSKSGVFFGYYDHHCYLPLYVFCGDELLVCYLRPSRIDASKHTRAVLRLLARQLRVAWPEVKLTIRADSGFCRWWLMRWCDSNGIGDILGLAKAPGLGACRTRQDRPCQRAVRRDEPTPAHLRLVRVRGQELGPAPACDRQGRAHGEGRGPAIRGRERAW